MSATPDGIPIVELRAVPRRCVNCGGATCVLTDDVTRIGESLCLICWIAVLLLRRKVS